MYNRVDPLTNSLTNEFCVGLNEFINFAIAQDNQWKQDDNIRCPCVKCKNIKLLPPSRVSRHLIRNGFQEGYWNWNLHGEELWTIDNPANDAFVHYENVAVPFSDWGNYDDFRWDQRMVYDAVQPTFQGQDEDEATSSNLPQVEECDRDPFEGHHVSQLDERWIDIVKAADRPLFEGCRKHTLLSFVASLLYAKSEWNLPEAAFNFFNDLFIDIMPEENSCPENYYYHRKTINDLGLPVVKIDACPNGCMLYWKEHAHESECIWCGAQRYKLKIRRGDGRRKRIPVSVLRYLPLVPRLQRLYSTNGIAENMTWHATHQRTPGIMCHPSDSPAWQDFDKTHPDFASESRNVRLGLCADGFAPHGQFGKAYSCWPVIVTPYNLPPGMCMKSQYMFLTLICPPKNPKKNIDVFLQPLIEELKELWVNGFATFDVSKREQFCMRAALMWTVNDFPAYGMLSGWSTAGRLGCPICMQESQAHVLKYSKKASYFDCHRAFLDDGHAYRTDKRSFIKGRVERNRPPTRLSGEAIFAQVFLYQIQQYAINIF